MSSHDFLQSLPSKPNLEKQKNLAKKLIRQIWAGEEEALARLEALHPLPPTPADCKLNDAQLVLARSYGFASWAKMRERIDALTLSPIDRFKRAVEREDHMAMRELLEQHEEVRQAIDKPMFAFDSMAIHQAANNQIMLNILLNYGADINAMTEWWAGGFSIFDWIEIGMADEIIRLGGKLTVHGAARMNRLDDLKAMLEANPSLAKARGGDGQTPLHVAGSLEVIDLLLDYGAELDVKDVDHEATPAQYLVDHPKLCAHLVQKGARTDLLMACALGDAELARHHLELDPQVIRMRVSEDWFPKKNPKAGGHIYNWKLGFYRSAFQIARSFGHDEVLAVLHDFASPVDRLLDAIWAGPDEAVDEVLADYPDLVASLDASVTRQIADAGFHNDLNAMRRFLKAGFPVTARGHQDAFPLHWAAHHGNPEMVEMLLAHDPPLDQRDGNGNGIPIGWCMYGSTHAWPSSTNEHEAVARLLLDAGSVVTPDYIPCGNEALDEIIRQHLFA